MAIRFDAIPDNLNRSRLAGAKTVMAWVYIITDRNSYSAFFGLDANEIIATDSSGTRLMHWDGSLERTGTNLSTGTWYHLAYTSDGDSTGNGFAVYLNGAVDISNGARSVAASGATMYLANDPYDEWLYGRMAHVKVWNAALSAAEIAQEIYTIRPQRLANLWSWLPIIETGTARSNEWSGSGNTWSVGGSVVDEDGPPLAWGSAPWVIPFVASGGGPTTYYSTPAGSVAPAGAQARRTSKAPAGSVTPTGAPTKRTSKTPAGSVGLAGALAAVRTVLASAGGVIAPAGALARSTAKGLAGALAPAGTLARSTAKNVAGSVGLAGTLARSTAKNVAGSLALAGTLAGEIVSGIIEQAVGGTLALAGSLARTTSTTMSGALAPAGSIARQIAKTLAGALALAGSVVTSWISPSAPKLDATLSDAAQTTLTIANAAQTTLAITNAAQTTLAIGDAAL